MLEARGDLAGGDGAADPLDSDPTTAANVGASLAAVRLRRIVGRPGASHACDHGTAAARMVSMRMNVPGDGCRHCADIYRPHGNRYLLPLKKLNVFWGSNGAGAQNRTVDLLITNQLLYP
jgi:hypothetical protein